MVGEGITWVGSIVKQHHSDSLEVEVLQLLVVGQRYAAVQGTRGCHHTRRWKREGNTVFLELGNFNRRKLRH